MTVIRAPDAPAPPPVQDTTIYRRAPVSPLGAFARSLILPGWGQAALDRRVPAGVFMAWEAVALGMTVKSSREYHYAREHQSPELAEAKKQEREDWLVLVIFNHLLSGLEAFVSSHLFDFPEDVRIRALPSPGGAGQSVRLQVAVPLRLP